MTEAVNVQRTAERKNCSCRIVKKKLECYNIGKYPKKEVIKTMEEKTLTSKQSKVKEERMFNKKDVVKAANLMILRKVVDKMQIKSETFYKELGTNKNVVDRIVRGEYGAGSKWNSKAAADKMKVDNKIFTGDYLINIKGKAIEELQKNFERLVNDNNSADQVRKSKLLKKKEEYETEYALWKAILENKSYEESDTFHKSKVLILNEVGKQVEEEDFRDLQLMKIWNYFRKLKEKINFSQKE